MTSVARPIPRAADQLDLYVSERDWLTVEICVSTLGRERAGERKNRTFGRPEPARTGPAHILEGSRSRPARSPPTGGSRTRASRSTARLRACAGSFRPYGSRAV